MSKELGPAKGYCLFNWPILASMVDIQPRFSDWYEWALTQCESCRPKHRLNSVNDINVTTQNYSSLMCVCHEQSPYSPQEKWSLQKALIYAAHMFIDKSHRINHWAGGLTGNNSILSLSRRKKMINYAVSDAFTTTYLIRPVLEYWTFQKLKNINIVELYTSFKSLLLSPLPANNSLNRKIENKNINTQKFFNALFADNDKDLGICKTREHLRTPQK